MDDQQKQQPQPATPVPPPFQLADAEPPTDPSAQPIEPPVTPSDTSTSPLSMPTPKPKKKRRFVIFGVIIALLVVLMGGSVLAYKFWYQNPDKVVTDGIMHAVSAKTMSFTSVTQIKGDTPATITLDGAMKSGAMNINADVKATVNGKSYSLKGSGLADEKGDLYVKATNVDAFVSSLENEETLMLPDRAKQIINDFVVKVNNQWIKISSSDVKTFSTSFAKGQTCLQDNFTKLRQDKSMSSELSDLYKKHKFIAISKELGSKDGSLGYEVKDNQQEAKVFAAGLKETRFYKSLKTCDSEISIDENDITDKSDTSGGTVEVWVNRWTHQLTQVIVSTEGAQSSVTSFKPTFNQSVTIMAPKSSKSVKDLQKDITDFTAEFSQELGAGVPAASDASGESNLFS